MSIVTVANVGQYGVNKDLSSHELPINAWTDCKNIRFLDGFAYQFYGHSEVYNSPSVVPQFVMQVNIATAKYWIYTSSAKTYAVTNTAGAAVHTDITHATPRTGVVNNWTGTLLSGIPILNAGDTSVPMRWNLSLGAKFVDLDNWQAGYSCKSIRAFKNFLIALNVTISGTNYPYMVKWSHPADPGTVPSSWDQTDTTKDAGQVDIADGVDAIVDGLPLRGSFMIYKEASAWRMDYIGGVQVFSFTKLVGTNGALNRNCIVEVDGYHLVLGASDVILHDGQTPTSILDKQTRRYLYQSIDVNNSNLCFVFKNPFFNEVFICYPSVGSSVCDKAMVWNYKDKTVSFRDLPSINHADYGQVDNTLLSTWASDADPWAADLTTWDGGDLTPNNAKVLMASNTTKLYMLDAAATFNGAIPSAYLERIGLGFGADDSIKTCRGVRLRMTGNVGDTVQVYLGYSNDPYTAPTYSNAITHTIGTTIACDGFVSGRYLAVKIASGTAYQWRLDSYDFDIVQGGKW